MLFISGPKNRQYRLLYTIQIVSLTILFCFLLLLTIYKPLNQDEGVFLTIGKFLHHGVLPYRDIFDHKPPGIYFLNYLILGVFNNIIFLKIIYAIINLFSALLITKIYHKITNNPRYIFLPAIFFLIMMMIFEGNYVIAEVPMIFCILLALNFALLKNVKLYAFQYCSSLSRTNSYDKLLDSKFTLSVVEWARRIKVRSHNILIIPELSVSICVINQ